MIHSYSAGFFFFVRGWSLRFPFACAFTYYVTDTGSLNPLLESIYLLCCNLVMHHQSQVTIYRRISTVYEVYLTGYFFLDSDPQVLAGRRLKPTIHTWYRTSSYAFRCWMRFRTSTSNLILKWSLWFWTTWLPYMHMCDCTLVRSIFIVHHMKERRTSRSQPPPTRPKAMYSQSLVVRI